MRKPIIIVIALSLLLNVFLIAKLFLSKSADLNFDGRVNNTDFSIMLSQWSK